MCCARFSIVIPLSESDKEKLTVRMKQTFGDREYEYKKDKLENKESSFLLEITDVAFLTDLNLGVFARQSIKKGTVIGYYEGEIVDLSFEKRDTIYLMYLNSNNTRGVDAMTVFNWTRFMNHSDFSFNCDFLLHENAIQVITVKDVKKGEQLLSNYGHSYNFQEKFYMHSSHNHQLPLDIVSEKSDRYFDVSSQDFDTLIGGDRDFFWDSRFDTASLTTLSKEILSNSKLDPKQLKAMVESPSYIFRTPKFAATRPVCLQEITPLMLACYKGFVDKVKALLQYGADPTRGSFKDGRNSFVFTILSKASIKNRIEILKLLVKNLEKKFYRSSTDQFDLMFLQGKDVKRMSVFDYLCNSNLVFDISQENRLNYFKTKFFCGEFSNRFSANVLGQLRIDDIQIDLPDSIPFDTKIMEMDKETLWEVCDSGDLEKLEYYYVKYRIDHEPIKGIKKCLERFENRLNDEEKSFEMYKQIFTHSVAYIKSNVDLKQIKQSDEIFYHFECKITWEMKMEIFDYALQNVKFWHGRVLRGTAWNSNAGMEYIKKRLSDVEYNLIN